MVAETAEVTLLGSIDKFAFTQRHEVEVLDAFLVISDHPTPEGGLSDDFANVLEYEVMRLEVDVRTQAKAFLFSLDDRYIGVETSAEALILTFGAAVAIIAAFHLRGAVDAVGVLITRIVSPGQRICLLSAFV